MIFGQTIINVRILPIPSVCTCVLIPSCFLINFNLQAKEKLINSLQSGEGGAVGVASEAKLEEMRLEKEHSQAQLQTALQQIENLKTGIQVYRGKCYSTYSLSY